MAKLIVVTGARGTGKTQLAATYAPPSQVNRVFYHDSEKSANNVRDQFEAHGLKFGHYVDLAARFSFSDDLMARINEASHGKSGDLPWVTVAERNALIDYYLFTLDDLDKKLVKGAYTVYVHDTLEKLEAGMAAWVEAHKRQSGVTQTAYGKLWTEGVYPLYEQLIAAVEARGVEAIILTSHLRTPWENNRPVLGKIEPSAKKLLYRLSSLMLWLIHEASNSDGAPAALVLKERMGTLAPDGGDTWAQARKLPQRIPHCTWNDINRYVRDGCDLAHPAPGEVMTRAEEDMIGELLTDKQMELMILLEQKDVIEMQQGAVVLTVNGGANEAAPASVAPPTWQSVTPAPVISANGNLVEIVKQLWREGKDETAIREALIVPLPLVRKTINELRAAGEVQPL